MSYLKSILAVCLLLTVSPIFGQEKTPEELDEYDNYINWFNLDIETNKKLGTSIDKAYRELLKDKTSKKTVVVAVIDSGVDTEHDDLKGKIWVNKDEIPDNNIDDDKNGYVDDVHGWNFLGNSKGEHVDVEHYEFTRIVKNGSPEDADYRKAKEMYDASRADWRETADNIEEAMAIFRKAKKIIKAYAGVEVKEQSDLLKVKSSDKSVLASKEYLNSMYSIGFTDETAEELQEEIDKYLQKHLSVKYDPRALIGDDYTDINDRGYGNPDVRGKSADHGTAVAGIIAAVRNNDLGINGVATHVQIMALRAVPDGDEYDKDIALAIRYAVDNGADIINMSFGKSFSPQKKFVDDAVKYAEENNVLMICSAGNDAQNLDAQTSYPNDKYLGGGMASNWLNVGATRMMLGKEMVSGFSNYGANEVDIFAPGSSIICLDVDDTYSMHDGTSFSSPVVSGIAALILAYYPDIKPKEMIQLLMDTAYKPRKPKKVLLPSEEEKRPKTKFSELSQSGGIINAYQALMEAEKRFAKAN